MFIAAYKCKTTSAKKAWSEKYIKGKQVKDRRSLVFCRPLSSSTFFLIFFPAYFPGTTNSPKQATPMRVFLRPPKFLDSFLQWQVNVNFPSPSGSSPFLRRFFLTDLQQKNFYIHKGTLSMSKLVIALEVCIRQQKGKKAC